MIANSFKMTYDWDDPEQASYNKTLHHIQHGKLIVWKFSNETDEEFIKRAGAKAHQVLTHVNRKSTGPVFVTHYEFYNRENDRN